MRLVFALVTALLIATGSYEVRADDISKVMCEQFAIKGATRTVEATTTFDADFAPAHHAPRNIPIEVAVPADADAFIHFPIVQDGTYIVYASDPSRIAGLKKKDGETISSESLEAPASCGDALKGGLKADVNVGQIKGPVPIAIDLKKGAAETLRFIVSRDPIN